MYLSVDGGGSKLRMLLADDELNLVNAVECGGVNTNFIPVEDVRATINEAVERCVPEGATLRAVCFSLLCRHEFLEEPLSGRARVKAFCPLSEGELGLLAAVGQLQGFAALSGTGSHAFFNGEGVHTTVGGLGMLLGDEGSGYDIGQKGLKAAIQAHDGRGEPTMLLDLLLKRWGMSRESMMHRLYQLVTCSPTPRAVIASFAPVAGEAACMGDRLAIGIYEQAGRDMALHVKALMGKLADSEKSMLDFPITLCGGAWKGSTHMFRIFRRGVLERYPKATIVWPVFDAVAGGLIHAALLGGWDKDTVIGKLSESCSEYLYQKPDDWREFDNE